MSTENKTIYRKTQAGRMKRYLDQLHQNQKKRDRKYLSLFF